MVYNFFISYFYTTQGLPTYLNLPDTLAPKNLLHAWTNRGHKIDISLLMNKTTPYEKDAKKILSEVQLVDPELKIDSKLIEMTPYYWNYSLVTNFPFIPVCIYIFLYQNDLKTSLLCILGIGILLFNIFNQLRFYNKLILDLQNKTITIKPNPVTGLYTKEKIIPFNVIRKVNYTIDGFWLAYRRYVITMNINENRTSLKLISTKKEVNAKRIVTALIQLL